MIPDQTLFTKKAVGMDSLSIVACTNAATLGTKIVARGGRPFGGTSLRPERLTRSTTVGGSTATEKLVDADPERVSDPQEVLYSRIAPSLKPLDRRQTQVRLRGEPLTRPAALLSEPPGDAHPPGHGCQGSRCAPHVCVSDMRRRNDIIPE